MSSILSILHKGENNIKIIINQWVAIETNKKAWKKKFSEHFVTGLALE